jgi:hypothetical protein
MLRLAFLSSFSSSLNLQYGSVAVVALSDLASACRLVAHVESSLVRVSRGEGGLGTRSVEGHSGLWEGTYRWRGWVTRNWVSLSRSLYMWIHLMSE